MASKIAREVAYIPSPPDTGTHNEHSDNMSRQRVTDSAEDPCAEEKCWMLRTASNGRLRYRGVASKRQPGFKGKGIGGVPHLNAGTFKSRAGLVRRRDRRLSIKRRRMARIIGATARPRLLHSGDP